LPLIFLLAFGLVPCPALLALLLRVDLLRLSSLLFRLSLRLADKLYLRLFLLPS